MFITAQIDLTEIGKLVRENPDLAKKVNFSDGEHMLLNIVIGDKKQPDRFGNDISINCKPKDAPTDVKWYIGSGLNRGDKKTSPSSPTPFATPQPQGATPSPVDDMPF